MGIAISRLGERRTQIIPNHPTPRESTPLHVGEAKGAVSVAGDLIVRSGRPIHGYLTSEYAPARR